jgi:hypothetical protein
LINLQPLIHGQLILSVIINTNVLIIIKLILSSIVLLHIFHEVLALNLVLRVVYFAIINIVDIFLDMLLADWTLT